MKAATTMKKVFLSILIIMLFVSCSEPRIDGSSEASLLESWESMEKSLTEEEKEELAWAITFLSLDETTGIDLMVSVVDPSVIGDEAREKLDGLTRSEILEKADEVRKRKGEALRGKLESIFNRE